MSANNEEVKPRRSRTRRKLTPFLCQEMLYDYALDRLDEDRKLAVDEYLKGDADCRNILDGIRKGLEYSEGLDAIEIKPDVLKHLSESENVISLGRRYSTYSEWDEKIRWSINAVVIVLLTAGICSVIPWNKIKFTSAKKNENVELAQLPHAGDQQLAVAEEQKDDSTVDQGSGDEEIGEGDEPAPQTGGAKLVDKSAGMGPKVAPKPVTSGDEEGDDEGDAAPPAFLKQAPPAPVVAVAPPVVTPVTPAKPGGASAVAASSASEKADEQDVAAKDSAKGTAAATTGEDAKQKGFVMRAFMTLSNLDELGPKITENITELGGDKAGEVELGWKRGSGRYYHFSLPEENEDKLLEKLRAYGPVRLSKDPHSRVMPQGQVRFILWVESAH